MLKMKLPLGILFALLPVCPRPVCASPETKNYPLAKPDSSKSAAMPVHNESGVKTSEDKVHINLLIKKVENRDYLDASNYIENRNNAFQFQGISCFNFLITVADYGSFKDFDAQRIIANKKNDCDELIESLKNGCDSLCAEKQSLFKILTDNSLCNNSLEEIKRKYKAQNKRNARRNNAAGGVLLGSGIASIVAASILGPVSRYSSACYSTQNLPNSSDGKELPCIYPLNYEIGAPILAIAGAGLTIGGIVALSKAHTVNQTFTSLETKLDDIKCPPPLPPGPHAEGPPSVELSALETRQ